MTPAELTELALAEASRVGFHRAGMVELGPDPASYRAFRAWVERGHAGSMSYLVAPHQLATRQDPRALAPRARSALVVALAYAKNHGETSDDTDAAVRGSVARYARGRDYHGVVRRKLDAVEARMSAAIGAPLDARPCVDSAPLLERAFARAAGIGFIGKNAMLIAPGLGSYFVLGALLLDCEAEPTGSEAAATGCGQCRECLDACPTKALVTPGELQAGRCISYLTIERRGAIPQSLRAPIGDRIFGCDVCQEACPFNAVAPDRHAPDPDLAPLAPDRGRPDLLDLIARGSNQLRRYVDGTALRRNNRQQLLRNICIALGNVGDQEAIPALIRALCDRHSLVRGHAAWALGRLGARAALVQAHQEERDPYVLSELRTAIGYCDARPAQDPASDPA